MYMYGSKKQADLRELHRGKGYGDGEICLVEAMMCKNRQRGGTHDCDVEVQAVLVKHELRRMRQRILSVIQKLGGVPSRY